METQSPAPGVSASVQDAFVPAASRGVTLGGRVGERLDSVVRARITSAEARDVIYPEAVAAFRNRVDDRTKPGFGFWQGEFWGKWVLSAIAAYRYSGDPELKQAIRRAVDELLATQREDGYIGTYHDSGLVQAEPRRPNWNVWCRKYTLWGLVEAYEVLGDPDILPATCRFVDHLISEVGPDGVPIVETGKFDGLPSSSILTPLLILHRHTAEKPFLDYAEYIVEQWASRPGRPPDIVNKGMEGKPVHAWFPHPEHWTKAYEFVSCVEGMVGLYRVTGSRDYLTAAVNIHRGIREADRNVFGGIGKNDKLLGSRFLLETEAEVCDAVYWNRLSAQLLRLTGDVVYAHEIERTLYNVLCGAMKPDGSWGVRRLCLSGEHWPAPPHCELGHHHCCVNNVPRGLLQVAEFAAMHAKDGVVVNLYIGGETAAATPSGNPLTLQTETDYPESGAVRLTLRPAAAEAFKLRLRIPQWSRETTLTVNGMAVDGVVPGEYVEIDREWRSGDTVGLILDMRARLILFPTPPGVDPAPAAHVAIAYGPIVLARDIRLGQTEIHEPVAIATDRDGFVPVERVAAPGDMWMAFRVPLRTGGHIAMTDFSSAGQTWDKATSDFRVWLPVSR